MADPAAEARVNLATAVLEADVGTWDVVLQIRPAPGSEPLVQRAVLTARLVGKRWLVTDHAADSGFEGHGVYGWDDERRRYTGVWIDGVGQAFAHAQGAWDPATKTMTWSFETAHAGKPHRYREITTTRPDGTRLYRHLVALPGGGEHEMITATHTRRSDGSDVPPGLGSGGLAHTSGW